MLKRRKHLYHALAGLTLLILPCAASGQTGSSDPEQPAPADATENTAPDQAGVADIVVTAQKRSESVQHIPLAVTAVSGPALTRLGVTSLLDLGAAVPSLSIQNNAGSTYIYLRGVGNNFLGLGTESNVAYHADGVYIARSRSQVASYFDVDRIEVVRGPQGDLYGRNATGGSINVITRKPTENLSVDATLSAGNYGLVRGEVGIGGAIIPGKLAVRAAGYVIDRGGFGVNEVTGRDVNTRKEQAGRLTLRLTPSEDFTLEVVGDYFHARDSLNAVHQAGGALPGVPTFSEALGDIPSDIRNIIASVNPRRDLDVWGVAGTASLDLSANASIRSITAYRESEYRTLDDLTGNDPTIQRSTQRESQHQFSEELQVLANGTNWDLIVGGYYFTENVNGFANIPIFFAPTAQFDQRGYQITRSYAAFAHGSYGITDHLKLVLGARYSKEDKTSAGTVIFGFPPALPTGGRVSFDAFTPKATLQYEPSANLSLYAGVSKGFKSGGFTIGAPGPAVQPETLISYEAGVKAQLFDRRLSANVAAFWYDYSDMIVTRIVGASTIDENAGKATIKGLEFELTALPVEHLQLTASLGLLDPKFDRYLSTDPLNTAAGVVSLAGNRLPGAATYSGRLGANYDIPVGDRSKVNVAGDMVFSGDMYFDPYEHKTAYQGAYELYNATLTFDSGRFWSVSAWIRNITDKTVVSNQVISADFLGFPRLTYLRDPRTFGADLKIKF